MGGFAVVQRALVILTTRKQPWRRHLLAARVAAKLPKGANAVDRREQWLEQALPGYPDLLFPYALYLSETDRSETARELVESFQDAYPESSEWQLAAATCWYHFKEFQRGDLAMAAAEQLDPESVQVQLVNARIHRERGNAFLDLKAHEHILEFGESRSRDDVLVGMSVPLFNLGRFEDVVKALGDLDLKGRHWHTPYRLAFSLAQCGQTAQAKPFYALSANRAELDVARQFQEPVLHLWYGNLDASLEAFERVGVSPSDPEAMRAWSRACDFAGEHGRALEILEMLVAGESADAATWFEYGAALEAHDRWDEAHEAFMRAGNQSRGRKARAYYYYAFRSAVRGSRPDLGMQVFSLPAFSKLQRRSDSNEGIRALEQRLLNADTTRQFEKAAFRLGTAHLTAGNTEAALAAFIDVVGQQRPSFDQRGWQNDYELTKMEFYLEQLEAAPVVEDLVFVESFLGRRVSCSPYALLREGLQNPELAHLRFVVAVTESTEIPVWLRDHPRAVFVERGTLGYLRTLARAKYLINNVTFPDYFVRRPEQKYLNTWHGIPWKYLGRDIADGGFTHGNVVKNMLAATHLAMPDAHTAEVLVARQGLSDLLTSPAALTGSPRLDTTLGMDEATRCSLRQELGLSGAEADKSLVLYAPTWREWAETLEDPGKDFRNVVEALSQRLPDAQIAVRAHHFLEASIADLGEAPNVVVVPNTIDTNDLLAAADVLVSDYSSIIFDFAATGRPILKLTDDIERYRTERGLYFDESEVPGASCSTIDALVTELQRVLREGGSSNGGEFTAFEDGRASKRVWEFLLSDQIDPARLWKTEEEGSSPESVLISVSGLNPNGITRSLQSLVKNLRLRGVKPYVLVYPEVLRNPSIRDIVEDIQGNAELIPAYNTTYRTFSERAAYRIFNSAQNRRQFDADSFIGTTGRREFRRQFTDAAFDAVVEFDGYNPNRTILCAFGSPDSRRLHVFHNEFRQEISTRFPRLRSALTVIGAFDRVASVSDAVRAENAALLAEYGVDPAEHRVIRNTLDVDRIRTMSAAPLRSDIQAWMRSAPDSRVAIMMGRLSPEKNHIETFKALKESNARGARDTRLLVMGDGPLRLQLEAQVTALGLEGTVMLAGFDANPYPALLAADAMFLPSLYEGQPIVLLESLTLGKPTVASDIPGSRSVLSGVEGAILVPGDFEGICGGFDIIAGSELRAVEFDAGKYNDEVVQESLSLILAD